MSALLERNVNDHTEKKNGLTYLSWAWAWAEVLKIDPDADWYASEYGPQGSEVPYMRMEDGTCMVRVFVRLNGKVRSSLLPVMDHRNKAIPNPNAFQINTAIMRCLAKAISMHGLGLYIYAGEDLPEIAQVAEEKPKLEAVRHSPTKNPNPTLTEQQISRCADVVLAIHDRMRNDDIAGAYGEYASVTDTEEKVEVWSKLSSTIRRQIKEYGESIKETA